MLRTQENFLAAVTCRNLFQTVHMGVYSVNPTSGLRARGTSGSQLLYAAMRKRSLNGANYDVDCPMLLATSVACSHTPRFLCALSASTQVRRCPSSSLLPAPARAHLVTAAAPRAVRVRWRRGETECKKPLVNSWWRVSLGISGSVRRHARTTCPAQGACRLCLDARGE